MEIRESQQQVPSEPTDHSDQFPELNLQSLLESSREAISRAASEVLKEKEEPNLMATAHGNHSSYSSSSGPWG